MSNDEKLMSAVLAALKDVVDAEEARSWGVFGVDKQTPLKRARSAIDALRERLAQPEQMTACPHGMPHRWPCEICEPEQESVAHCEAGPEHCPVCHKESSPAQQPEQEPGFLGQLHKIFGGN